MAAGVVFPFELDEAEEAYYVCDYEDVDLAGDFALVGVLLASK